VATAVISPAAAESLFTGAGFSKIKSLSSAADHHYGFIFAKDTQ
jgi:hypothetical protein